jgi:cell volume regulation protein A
MVAAATAIYGLATVAHGSGFLAVFLAGILLGGVEAPYQAEVERFTSALASLGEMVAFIVLGLSISLIPLLRSTDTLVGLAVAALLIFAVRPVLVGVVLIPVRLRASERVFVLWAGLKGAVPILLGLFLLAAGLPDAPRLYRIIFVVVLVSVVLQGGSVPLAARLLRIPMRDAGLPRPDPAAAPPRDVPTYLHLYTVMAGSLADGSRVTDLALEERTELSLVRGNGELLPLRHDSRLHAGDQVLAHSQVGVDLDALFHADGR